MEYATFYNSKNGDRKYDAESFAEWLEPFFLTGVFNGDLQVLANGTMSVSVEPGSANIKGKLKTFDEITTLTLDMADATLNRIDNIIVRRDDEARDFTIMVQKGTSASVPVAPAPIRANGKYDLVLAQVYVAASAIAIEQANITDTRMNEELCGWVASTVNEIDFEQITLQWQDYISNFKTENEEEFNEWFERFKEMVEAGTPVMVDDELSTTSSNPIANATVAEAVNGLSTDVSALETSLNGLSFKVMTEAAYNALTTKDSNTIYFLTE